ncbi:MAG: NUDIX hydrolase [Candidatus Nanoarchaeia archaeon]
MKDKPNNLESRIVYDKRLKLRQDILEIKGILQPYTWESVIPGDGVGVLAFLDNDTMLLSKQYRPSVKDYVIELIQGGISRSLSEIPIQAAQRELLEETGYDADLKLINVIYPVAGFADMRMHIFEAHNMKKINEPQDNPYEQMELVKIPYKEALNLAIKGDYKDSLLVIALLNHELRKK